MAINSILRSNNGNKYLLYIYESIDKAMSIKARDRESIKKVIVLSSITNSYVEGTASSIDLCGQTVRNNLKQQDPERVLLSPLNPRYLLKLVLQNFLCHFKRYCVNMFV